MVRGALIDALGLSGSASRKDLRPLSTHIGQSAFDPSRSLAEGGFDPIAERQPEQQDICAGPG